MSVNNFARVNWYCNKQKALNIINLSLHPFDLSVTHVHMHAHFNVHTHMRACTHTLMHACMHANTLKHTRTHTHTHSTTHTTTHTHACTHTLSLSLILFLNVHVKRFCVAEIEVPPDGAVPTADVFLHSQLRRNQHHYRQRTGNLFSPS